MIRLQTGKLIDDKNCPTQRAPDGWESARFQAGLLAPTGSVNAALSRPAPAPVTHPVRRLPSKSMSLIFENFILGNSHVKSKETVWHLNGYIHRKT
jgi:hypothetical protein